MEVRHLQDSRGLQPRGRKVEVWQGEGAHLFACFLPPLEFILHLHQPHLTLRPQVIFTDLSKEDVSGAEGRVWLVCNVIGDGNYQALASDFQINKSFSRSDIAVKSGLSFRKPLGVATTEVTVIGSPGTSSIE